MKILVIQGSPDAKSYTHANALYYCKTAKKMQKDVKLVDLATDHFDPVLRYGYRQHMDDESYPNKMQELIKWADHLVFFFPVWWSAEPSILKGWIERVFTPGFAYHFEGLKSIPLLKGRTAEMFLTCHAPTFFYSLFGGVITRWKHFILGSCGIKLTRHLIMGSMDSAKDTLSRRITFMRKCSSELKHL
ncbi:NAD(P)H-dependent oxidoreductase [Acetilactobacillus jinshanensis]|uniref:Flavodoxin family protein n=1 Tax=Acetilactobacillus jinshanensis TaxID=1720083 RepID=A0A4V1ALS1_9LACO|nr:NAD(P)H-dependent oxidoreductase [Acetilactobacillus jinshanensis]QBP18579.1 flavodoxin family protein [Acetilactobacillus jinshanensis]URL61455.1 NAD(P)H-dependent oxidoreductase [uncultured bacterium]